MTALRIRRARRADAPALLELIRALADYEKLEPPTPAARRRLTRDGFGPRPRFRTLMAFWKGEPVAYALVFETYSSFLARPTLYLEDLFVLPGHRGRGIGLKLFRECLAYAKRRRCGRMEWVVLDWNRPAIRFYQRRGARHLREWLTYRIEI